MKNKVHQADQNFLDLLQRWLRGDFRRADEKSVQKLTADDDFRREAMEGFSQFSEVNHSEKLAVLRQRLAEKTGAAPQLRVVWAQRLMAAAAIFVFVFGTVWLFQKQDILGEKTAANLPQPAESQQIGTPVPQNSDAKIFTDTFSAEQNQPVLADKSVAGKTAAKPVLPPAILREKNQNRRQIGGAPPTILDDRETVVFSQKMEAEAAENVEMKDEIAAVRSAAPVPPPQPAAEKAAKEEAVDFVKTKMPATAKPGSPAKSMPAAKAKHDTDTKPNLDELRKKQEIPAAAEPAGGWENFDEYVRQNARLTPEAAKQMNSGTVGLQFYPQENGEPGTILITKPLGFGLDEEAKRLVQLFDWLPGKNNLVKLEIRFVR